MLDRQGSEVSIRRQVAGSANCSKESEQNVRMAVSRVDDRYLWSGEPYSNAPAGAADVEGIVENFPIRRDPDEA